LFTIMQVDKLQYFIAHRISYIFKNSDDFYLSAITFLLWLFRIRYPDMPPIIEATNIPIFACTLYSSCEKASWVTNKDIVNPIAPNNPKPKRFLRFIPLGNGAILSFTQSQVNKVMPTVLPINRPSATPKATLVLKSC